MTLRIGPHFGAIWTFLADGRMMTELCLTNFFKHPPNLTFSFWTKEIIWKGTYYGFALEKYFVKSIYHMILQLEKIALMEFLSKVTHNSLEKIIKRTLEITD